MKDVIIRQEGRINEIVYDVTVYNRGLDKFYLPLEEVGSMINTIISSNSTTKSLKIMPIYKNYMLNKELELEEHFLFISCRDNFSYEELIEHFKNYTGKHYYSMTKEEKKWATVLYPLCKTEDIKAYQAALRRFLAFLVEYIPALFQIVEQELMLKEKDIPFGYFCFNIDSD